MGVRTQTERNGVSLVLPQLKFLARLLFKEAAYLLRRDIVSVLYGAEMRENGFHRQGNLLVIVKNRADICA